LDGGEAFAIYRTDLGSGGFSLNQWISEATRQMGEDGYTTEEPTELTVADLPARRVNYTGPIDTGQLMYAVYVAVQVDPGVLFELGIYIEEDQRAKVEEDLNGLLSTFEWVR
jgi:hypothetical protein